MNYIGYIWIPNLDQLGDVVLYFELWINIQMNLDQLGDIVLYFELGINIQMNNNI